MEPPVPLTAELARRQTWGQVEDLLVEARLIRDRPEGGYMNDRMKAARQSAVPLFKADVSRCNGTRPIRMTQPVPSWWRT